MKFKYSEDPQGSPEWVSLRVGKVTASRLKDWMAKGKRDGKPLKARSDYERELIYEKQFGVPFTRFVTGAMEEGVMAEEFLKQQYSSAMGVVVLPAGAFYNDYFVASPDGLIGSDGLIEAKWFYDSSFADVLSNGIPDEYMLQVQGQLWASGRKWCDFVVGSGNAGKFKVIRVLPDPVIQREIEEAVMEEWDYKPFGSDNVFDFTTQYVPMNGGW